MLKVECGVLNVEWVIRHENISPTDRTDKHRCHSGCYFKEHESHESYE